jgi:hypothetical protein
MSARDIISECRDLESLHYGRNKAIGEAYRLLDQVDEMYQENMESFVGNDPRTLWNMGTYLLQPRPLVHTIERMDAVPFTTEEKMAAQAIERLFTRIWRTRNRSRMRRGGKSWFWSFIGSFTATGWYAVPFGMMKGGPFIDFWKPQHVYPEFSSEETEGLTRLARIRTIPWDEAVREAEREGWNTTAVPAKGQGNITEYQLWKKEGDVVSFGVVFTNSEVRPMSVFPGTTEIPVLAGATGGIPSADASVLILSTSDPRRMAPRNDNVVKGQSIMATNERVYAQFNRQQSFLQQLMHDTANPKTYEQTMGGRAIVENPDDLFKRGAHFRLQIGEALKVLETPGIPPEATQLLFGLRNMIQRGGFSDITFGNITTEVTSVLMTQAAESAQQLISPFHESIEFIFSEVAQSWLDSLLVNKYSLVTAEEQEALDILADAGDLQIEAAYVVKIPGDFASRLNMARASSSSFDMSVETAYRLFTPEITDIPGEMARVKSDRAQQDPAMQAVTLIQALREAATQLRDTNPQYAELYEKMAERVMQQALGEATSAQIPQAPSGALTGSLPPGVPQGAQNGRAPLS